MGDGGPTEGKPDHLSDREWADAILRRARERSPTGDGDLTELTDQTPLDKEAFQRAEQKTDEQADPTGSWVIEDWVVGVADGPALTREDLGSPDDDSSSYVPSVEREPSTPVQRSAEYDFAIPGARKRMGRAVLEWGAVIVGALVMAVLVKAFLFQAYYIPSPSMEPTLGRGDRIIVNKLSYRLHDVNRGDMVVFAAPEGTGGVDDLIKRVIGLPGELVRVEHGRVLIGEGMLLEPYLPIQDGTDDFRAHPNCANLPEDLEGCRIPPSHVFVLGDYRDNSRDSRFFGPIPEDSIRGRAFLRIWPIGEFRRL